MDQINYRAESFEGILPQLEVPDYSSSFLESGKLAVDSQRSILDDLRRNDEIDAGNMKRRHAEVNDLMKLSQKGLKKGLELQKQMNEDEYDRIFFEYYNKTPEELEALATQQQQEEDSLNAEVQEVNDSLAVEAEKDPINSGTFNQMRNLTGWRQAAAMNAIAARRVGEYPTFLDQIVKKLNPQSEEEYSAAQTEATTQWGRQTGMNRANPGFLAKHVLPNLTRENIAARESWTRNFNIEQGQETRTEIWAQLSNGTVNLNDALTQLMGTTSLNGRTMFSRAQAYSEIDARTRTGEITPDLLNKLGTEPHPVTKKEWNQDPKFGVWVANARRAQKSKRDLERSIVQEQLREAYVGIHREEDILRIQAEQRAAGFLPADIAAASNAAFGLSDRQIRLREEKLQTDEQYPDPNTKLPFDYHRNLSPAAKRFYANRLEPDPTTQSAEERVRDSDYFDNVEESLESRIAEIDPSIALSNKALGTAGPVNEGSFLLSAENWVAQRASQLMLSSDGAMSEQKAIDTALEEWSESMKAIHDDNPDNWFKDGRFQASGMVTGANRGQAQAAAMTARAIQTSTLDNLNQAFYESDYIYKPNQQYSERVKMLARRFGWTPREIVQRGRELKGLEPLPPIPGQESTGEQLAPADVRRLGSVTSPSVQSALRAQITSGQRLGGTPEQNTVAVGRQILAMGYGGVWQHQNFNYDTGYVPSGGQEYYRGAGSTSDHNKHRALDIGLQANGAARLEQLYQYLLKNKKRLGITQLIYAPKGSGRWDPDGSHWHHVHVAFGSTY